MKIYLSHYAPVQQQQMQEVVKPERSNAHCRSFLSLFPSLPSPTILNPVCVPQLQSVCNASELTCRPWSPYSMRRRYSLSLLYGFFFILLFFFSLRLWFHRMPRGLYKVFFTLFRFFLFFFVTCEVVKVKIDFHFIAACAWAVASRVQRVLEGRCGSRFSAHLLPLFFLAIYGMFYEWILSELGAHFFGA